MFYSKLVFALLGWSDNEIFTANTAVVLCVLQRKNIADLE